MKILILGGTQFLGRALVEAAHAADHEVTLFNRGRTNPDLFPDVEKLRGDRSAGDLDALRGREWDAVIDTSGYVPRVVRDSAALLRDSVRHYTFISSISVYAHPITPGSDESTAVATLNDPTTEEITGETYGALKALCENTVTQTMDGRALNVRAGLIVGPHDPTDRFTYWVMRIARGGDVLTPPHSTPVQVIDVRDLSTWIMRMIAADTTGTYNATGPTTPITMGDVFKASQSAGGHNAHLVEASESELVAHEVQPWSDLPLWLPAEMQGMQQISIARAINDGLTTRPIAETVTATKTWFEAERGLDAALKSGLARERENEVLAAL